MTTLTIHKLDPLVEQRPPARATRHSLTIEQEAERILEAALGSTEREPKNPYEAMRRHFRDLEAVDLDLPTRHPTRDVPKSRGYRLIESCGPEKLIEIFA